MSHTSPQDLQSLESHPLPLLKDTTIPPLSPKLTDLLVQARANIAQLDGYCLALPNPFLLLSPAIIKESLASSEIENIQTTLVEALQSSLFPESERREPEKEVLRYRESLLWGFDQIKKEIPLTSRLITGVQGRLMPNDGKYRSSQNVIWNSTTKEILLVPPKANKLPEFIKDWENFVNQNSENDPLVQVAIAHYQFESIHPFNDGNGRTGRILMILDLIQKGLLNFPILYVSGYISAHKDRYYKGLQSIRTEQNWDDYLEFMLEAFAEQAKNTSKTFFEIMNLFEEQKKLLQTKLPKIYSRELLEEFFNTPITGPVSLGKKLNIHYTTASRHLKSLEKIGMLRNVKIGRHQLYVNFQLIDILS